jgi:hypothetical protein
MSVLGHDDIVGNETADQQAKLGSECPFIRPETACGIAVGVAKKSARSWTKKTIKHCGSLT